MLHQMRRNVSVVFRYLRRATPQGEGGANCLAPPDAPQCVCCILMKETGSFARRKLLCPTRCVAIRVKTKVPFFILRKKFDLEQISAKIVQTFSFSPEFARKPPKSFSFCEYSCKNNKILCKNSKIFQASSGIGSCLTYIFPKTFGKQIFYNKCPFV